jgi:hypothetical protein
MLPAPLHTSSLNLALRSFHNWIVGQRKRQNLTIGYMNLCEIVNCWFCVVCLGNDLPDAEKTGLLTDMENDIAAESDVYFKREGAGAC